jgi:hypothetical protein
MKNFLDIIIAEPVKDFTKKVIDFLPHLLSAFIVLIVGFFAGLILKYLILKLLHIVKTDKFFQRTGITQALQKGGVKDSPTQFIGRIFYWLTVSIFVIMALYTLKIPAIENLLQELFLYLPNVFVAVIIVIIGYVLGNFLGEAVLIASVNAGIPFSRLLSRGVKLSIFLLAFTMALEQLGIGHGTMTIAFTIAFGGIVFALSLAFGLAGKDLAKDYLERKFEGRGEDEDKVQHL